MRIKVIIVANRTPNPRLSAIGMRNFAWILFSNNIGESPKNVVSVVRMIGLNLAIAQSRTNSMRLLSAVRLRLIKSTKIRESLTTTPVKATMPINDINPKAYPVKTWPHTAPIIPKGIALMIIMGSE